MRPTWQAWTTAALIPSALWTGLALSAAEKPLVAQKVVAEQKPFSRIYQPEITLVAGKITYESTSSRSKSSSSTKTAAPRGSTSTAMPRSSTATPTQPRTAPQTPAGGETDLQRELREVYRKNGREMPEMNLQQMDVPAPEPGTANSPGESGVQFARPASAPAKQPSMFERVFMGRKAAPEPVPVQKPGGGTRSAQRPETAGPQRPAMLPTQEQGLPEAGIQAAQPTPMNAARSTPKPHSVAPRVPAEFQNRGVGTPVSDTAQATKTLTEDNPFDDVPTLSEPEESLDFEAPGTVPSTTSTPQNEAAPEAAATLEADGATEAEAPAVEENPFTGLKLNVPDEPAPAVPDETEAPVENPLEDKKLEAAAEARHRSLAEEQSQQLQSAPEASGLKGFCPVTLRRYRRLVAAQPDLVATHEGQVYQFATTSARTEFEKRPLMYIPAYGGHDPVAWMDDEERRAGSLDFAAWYQGRLYLFASQDSLAIFQKDPDLYFEELPGDERSPVIAPPAAVPAQTAPRTTPQTVTAPRGPLAAPVAPSPATIPAPMPEELPTFSTDGSEEADPFANDTPADNSPAEKAPVNAAPASNPLASEEPLEDKEPAVPELSPIPEPSADEALSPIPDEKPVPSPRTTKPRTAPRSPKLLELEDLAPVNPPQPVQKPITPQNVTANRPAGPVAAPTPIPKKSVEMTPRATSPRTIAPEATTEPRTVPRTLPTTEPRTTPRSATQPRARALLADELDPKAVTPIAPPTTPRTVPATSTTARTAQPAKSVKPAPVIIPREPGIAIPGTNRPRGVLDFTQPLQPVAE